MSGNETVAGTKTFTNGIISFRPIGTAITGTAYTLAIGDANRFLEANNSSNLTITVPNDATVAYEIGTEIEVVRANTGEVSFVAGASVTINSAGTRLRIAEQHSAVVLKKTAINTWRLLGATKV
jgi:hypothetical protein